MTPNQSATKINEPPMSMALLIAGIVACGYGYISNPEYFTRLFYEVDHYADRNLDFLTVVGLSIILNSIWIYSVVTRTFGLQKQGSRLEVLAGKSKGSSATQELKHLLLSMMIALIFHLFLVRNIVGPEAFRFPERILRSYAKTFQLFTTSSLSTSVFVITHLFSRFLPIASFSKLLPMRLPKFPKIKNSLVLGAVGEADHE